MKKKTESIHEEKKGHKEQRTKIAKKYVKREEKNRRNDGNDDE